MMLRTTSPSSTPASQCMPRTLTCPTRNLRLPPPNVHFNPRTKSSNLPPLKSSFSTKTTPHPALRSDPTNLLQQLSQTLTPDFKNPHQTRAKKSDFEVWFHDNFHPYGKMTEKPKWWWRSLASIFYLKPLLQFGAYGIFDPAYKVSPVLKNYGELTWEPHIRFIACFPQWLWYVYQTILYFTVRRTELPHYLRFHMINGFLIDMALEISVYVNRWFPYSWLWSKIGMHVLAAIGIAYVLTILECIRCALAGKYADVPFFSDSSFIHTHVR